MGTVGIADAKAPRKRIDITALRTMVGKVPMQAEPAGEFIRRMRNKARY